MLRPMKKLHWAAPERNKEPILAVLARVLPGTGRVLEVASGSGQHAVHFAAGLPALTFLPSDIEPENLESIRAWAEAAGLANLREPSALDVCCPDWGVGTVEAIFNANMLHISPWECALALFTGAARHLAPSGVLVLYGPYRIAGRHTAESNAAFDAELRQRDARFGVRDLEAVCELAQRASMTLEERVCMPANNQLLVFRKLDATAREP
jgi:SAM-dependent methyltransferase